MPNPNLIIVKVQFLSEEGAQRLGKDDEFLGRGPSGALREPHIGESQRRGGASWRGGRGGGRVYKFYKLCNLYKLFV